MIISQLDYFSMLTKTPISQEVLALPFEEYSLDTVREIVNSRGDMNSLKALLFFNGDHWQGGHAWIGPRYPEGHKLYTVMLSEVERTMISHNVIAEMVGRHVDGVLARELHWKLVLKETPPPVEEESPLGGEKITKPGEPSAEENNLIKEAQDALVEWWGKRNVTETLKHALAGLLCVRRSPLRFSIPPALRDEEGNLPFKPTLAEALDYLYLDHMGYDDDSLEQILPSCTVWVNRNSRQPIGLFYYKEGEEERAEITYIDEEGNTVLRLLSKEGDIGQAVALPLGGRILMYEMTRKALVTPQIMSQQKSLNKTLTMKDRNDTQGGYLERFLFNIKWPTKKVKNSEGVEEEVPDDMFSGPGTINSLQGATYQDETGVTRVMQPSVQFRDPVPATTFIESAEATYIGMLKEGNQLHHATTDADVSGESRKQARESYIKDLQSSAGTVEEAVVWLLETALTEAAILSNQAGRYDGLRAYAQCKIDPGPVSPDDLRVAAEMLDRGLWDWETAVSATGVDDVDTIKQRLAVERAENEARQLAFQENNPTPPDGGDTPTLPNNDAPPSS